MANISLLSRIVNGVQREVDISSNTLLVQAIQVNGTLLSSSSSGAAGSKLVGDDNSYSNFTPTAATVKGALSGIDTALASAGGSPAVYNAGNSGTSITINWNNSTWQQITLTGNVTISFSNAVSGGRYILEIVQGSSNYTVTFTNVLWENGGIYLPTAGSGSIDQVNLNYNGLTSSYRGFVEYAFALPSAPQFSNMNYWFRGDDNTNSGGSLSTWIDKTGNGFTTAGGSAFQVVTNDINGQTGITFSAANSLTMGSSANVVDPSQAFSVSFVVSSVTLTSGNYIQVIDMKGSSSANSMTIFIYNPGSGTIFQIQTGSGTTTIETAPLSGYTSYSTYNLTYNGSGFSSASNFVLQVNGSTVSLTESTGSGGDTASNVIGGGSIGSGVAMHIAELVQWKIQLSSSDLASLNAYYSSRYAL